MKRVKLFIAAVLLPAAAVVTRRAEKDVSKFGPGACVSAWVGEGNRVIVETKCKEQPAFSAYALHLICVDQDGGRVLHSFEKGGFDPEEVFDTQIVCDKCEAGDLDEVPQVFLTKPKDGQQDIDRLSEGQEGKDDSAWPSLEAGASPNDDSWKSLGDTSLVTPDSGIERDTSFTPWRAPGAAPAAIAGASPSPAPAAQPGLRIADTRLTALEEEVAKLTDSTLQISQAMSSLRDKVMRKVNLKPAEKSESSSKSAERSVSEGSSSTSAERSVSEVEPSKEAPAAPEGSKKEAGAALALSGAKLMPTQLAGMVGALSPVAVEAKSKEILDSVQEAEKEAEQAALEAEESEVRQQAPAATAQALAATPVRPPQVPATSAAAVQPVVAATSAAAVQPVVTATSAAAVQPVLAATSAAAVQPVVAASAGATAPPVQKTATTEQPQAMRAQPPTQQLKSTPVPPVTQAAVPAVDAQSEGSVETEAEKQEDEDLAGLLVDSD